MNLQRTWRFDSALTSAGWMDDVLISVDSDGRITKIDSGDSVQPSVMSSATNTGLVALPGMVNVHSHAFQRAFAGLSEYRSAGHDSFWTWRELMYRFLTRLNPDDVYLIARQLYLEMLAAGYTWVGEFHYLHNDPQGNRYSNPAEMSASIIRAAADAGIGLCLLPVLYQRGGFDGASLEGGQLRFGLSDDRFQQVTDFCHGHQDANYRSGIALHSLRAVDVAAGARAVGANGSRPVHIHVAEQTKEVEDCSAVHKKRPVEFLFDQFGVDENWCLIHATHLNENEVAMIAGSSAVVGLCPTTEANLGDGFFSAEPYLNQGGRISIGSDSHIAVDFRDELRTLEYGQRLRFERRAVLGTESLSVGRRLYQCAQSGGAQAIGLSPEGIAVGQRVDMTLLDPAHPAVGGCRHDSLIDSAIFANCGNPVRGTMVGGRLRVVTDPEFADAFLESSRAFTALRTRLSG